MSYAAWLAAPEAFVSSTISSAISQAMSSICILMLPDEPTQVLGTPNTGWQLLASPTGFVFARRCSRGH